MKIAGTNSAIEYFDNSCILFQWKFGYYNKDTKLNHLNAKNEITTLCLFIFINFLLKLKNNQNELNIIQGRKLKLVVL